MQFHFYLHLPLEILIKLAIWLFKANANTSHEYSSMNVAAGNFINYLKRHTKQLKRTYNGAYDMPNKRTSVWSAVCLPVHQLGPRSLAHFLILCVCLLNPVQSVSECVSVCVANEALTVPKSQSIRVEDIKTIPISWPSTCSTGTHHILKQMR